MKVHEYQAKEILKSYGVPVPRGRVGETADEAGRIAKEIGTETIVVEAQINGGGRGKGGGDQVVHSAPQAQNAAKKILGMTLVTHQTGPAGRIVRKVLIEEGMEIEEELYLGMVVDRSKGCPVIMASREGGVEIEKVAAESPEKIIKEWISPVTGLRPFHPNKVGFGLGLELSQVAKIRGIV